MNTKQFAKTHKLMIEDSKIFEGLVQKAKSLGATMFGVSPQNGKRYYVIYNDKIIHFGSDVGKTFIDHRDPKIRAAWIARHSKIKNKLGQYVMTLRTSPSYWSKHLLW